MKQEVEYGDLTESDLSVEEFDRLDQVHVFSARYRKEKKKILREFKKNMRPSAKTGRFGGAVAVVILAISLPAAADAAMDSGFFGRVWGTAGRENIASRVETIYDFEKGTYYTVTCPAREYADMDRSRAEELAGSAVSYEPVAKQLGDTRLTVLASVCDGNTAVVEFMLEKEGGVDALNYSQADNESKGAYFSDSAPFYFQFADCHENIYVDLDRSSEDVIYCYDYMTVNRVEGEVRELVLEIWERDEVERDGSAEPERLVLPVRTEIGQAEYVSGNGGTLQMSPMSMKIDMNTVPGMSGDEAGDPYSMYYAAIHYKDGTDYVVHEHGLEGVHSCDVETDNVSYACGEADNQLVLVFNRLVDVEEVESVIVNGTVYVLKTEG